MSSNSISSMGSLHRLVDSIAENYNIPDNQLEVHVSHNPASQEYIIQISFRTHDRMHKYGGEIAVDKHKSGKLHRDIVERETQHLLQQLENSWLEEGGSVIFYKNHGFFYRMKVDRSMAALEVECAVCGYIELENAATEILEKYRDVFLMRTLPDAYMRCNCSH